MPQYLTRNRKRQTPGSSLRAWGFVIDPLVSLRGGSVLFLPGGPAAGEGIPEGRPHLSATFLESAADKRGWSRGPIFVGVFERWPRSSACTVESTCRPVERGESAQPTSTSRHSVPAMKRPLSSPRWTSPSRPNRRSSDGNKALTCCVGLGHFHSLRPWEWDRQLAPTSGLGCPPPRLRDNNPDATKPPDPQGPGGFSRGPKRQAQNGRPKMAGRDIDW